MVACLPPDSKSGCGGGLGVGSYERASLLYLNSTLSKKDGRVKKGKRGDRLIDHRDNIDRCTHHTLLFPTLLYPSYYLCSVL
jgi:hypothetical protein